MRFIAGNGDREVLALAAGEPADTVPEQYLPQMQWVADQLGAEELDRVGSWPPSLRLTTPALGDVLFCHATPRSDAENLCAHHRRGQADPSLC